MAVTPKRRARRSIPAVLMRAGTSKGLFLHRAHLPPLEQDWAGPLLAVMGSRYNDTRQIDGVGGASSVTSKVAVVAPSKRPGVDVDYTFVQVAVGDDTIDLTGNCGNMCSGVGPFAIQEGLVLVPPEARMVDVRIFNTNTERIIVETVEVDEDGIVAEDGTCWIPGVKGPGSEIKVAFIDPAGSMTGKLFPTGRRSERIQIEGGEQVHGLPLAPFSVEATLIDAANPFVVVDSKTLPEVIQTQPRDSPLSLEVAESIRRVAAVRMGLAATVEAAALVRGTPKLAYVSRPVPITVANTTAGALGFDDAAAAPPPDVQILAYSMGRPHPSLQLTGGVCLASAVSMEGTVPNRLSQKNSKLEPPSIDGLPPTPERTPSPSTIADDESRTSLEETRSIDALQNVKSVVKSNIRLAHGSGVMEVETWTRLDEEDEPAIDRCIVSRTARRLFEGNVLYYS